LILLAALEEGGGGIVKTGQNIVWPDCRLLGGQCTEIGRWIHPGQPAAQLPPAGLLLNALSLLQSETNSAGATCHHYSAVSQHQMQRQCPQTLFFSSASFLSSQGQADFMVLHNVARILELAVPLMDHPNEGFLAQLEEDMMKLVLKHGMMV
jgi:hypothetical protein